MQAFDPLFGIALQGACVGGEAVLPSKFGYRLSSWYSALSSFEVGKTLLDRVSRIRLFLIRLIFGIPAGNHLANRGNGIVGELLVNEALECMQVLRVQCP